MASSRPGVTGDSTRTRVKPGAPIPMLGQTRELSDSEEPCAVEDDGFPRAAASALDPEPPSQE